MLSILKQQEKTKWLGDVMSQPLQMAAKNADNAFSRFFKKQNKYPKFKSRNDRQCFKLPQGFQLIDGLLWLPKMKEGIKINLSREIKGKILYLHISKTTTDKYYVSFTCEVPKDPFPMTGKMTGIDVGIKHVAILSDGTKYENIKALKKL